MSNSVSALQSPNVNVKVLPKTWFIHLTMPGNEDKRDRIEITPVKYVREGEHVARATFDSGATNSARLIR
jgi:hypothetical protein